jgi:hypothetical protein
VPEREAPRCPQCGSTEYGWADDLCVCGQCGVVLPLEYEYERPEPTQEGETMPERERGTAEYERLRKLAYAVRNTGINYGLAPQGQAAAEAGGRMDAAMRRLLEALITEQQT